MPIIYATESRVVNFSVEEFLKVIGYETEYFLSEVKILKDSNPAKDSVQVILGKSLTS